MCSTKATGGSWYLWSWLLAACILTSGCAVHTPERATSRFIRELRGGVAQSQGPAAFEKTGRALDLTEQQAKSGTQIYRRSANSSRGKDRIGLVSSEVLRDAPDRFDLRLSWSPPRGLRAGAIERLLGKPAGKSASADDGWILGGGVLEYRAAETDVPYLLFSSPGYVRDPLDFLETAESARLPGLAAVSLYLDQKGRARGPSHAEGAGLESQEYAMASGVSIVRYSLTRPRRAPYLAGMTITMPSPARPADFVPMLGDLGFAAAEQMAAVFKADAVGDSFAVSGNFALALEHGQAGETTFGVWRRVESPRSWCMHLRPDLERCK